MMGKRRAALARMQRVIERAEVRRVIVAPAPLQFLSLRPSARRQGDTRPPHRLAVDLLPALPQADHRRAPVGRRLERRRHGALP
jgi:hypothetical protein